MKTKAVEIDFSATLGNGEVLSATFRAAVPAHIESVRATVNAVRAHLSVLWAVPEERIQATVALVVESREVVLYGDM